MLRGFSLIALIVFFGLLLTIIAVGIRYKISTTLKENVETTSATFDPKNIPDFSNTSLKNMILFSLDGRLIASDRDGLNPQFVFNNKDTHFISARNEGQIIYYYTQIEKSSEEFDVVVYKKDLKSGDIKDLLSFKAYAEGIDIDIDIDISPDENYLVYPQNGGLYIYDISKNKSKRILSPKGCEGYNTDCWEFDYGKWSPDGKKIVAKKVFYEGGIAVVVDPFSPDIKEKTVGAGATFIWSPDRTTLAVVGASYSEPGSIYLQTNLDKPELKSLLKGKLAKLTGTEPSLIDSFIDSLSENNPQIKIKDIEPKPEDIVSVDNATWLDSNRIAFLYSAINYAPNQVFQPGLGVYDIQKNSLKSVTSFDFKNNGQFIFTYSPREVLLQNEAKDVWLINIDTKQKTKLPIKSDKLIEIIN